MTWSVRGNEGDEVMIELKFNTARFSDVYTVYIHSADFQTDLTHTVSKVLSFYLSFFTLHTTNP